MYTYVSYLEVSCTRWGSYFVFRVMYTLFFLFCIKVFVLSAMYTLCSLICKCQVHAGSLLHIVLCTLSAVLSRIKCSIHFVSSYFHLVLCTLCFLILYKCYVHFVSFLIIQSYVHIVYLILYKCYVHLGLSFCSSALYTKSLICVKCQVHLLFAGCIVLWTLCCTLLCCTSCTLCYVHFVFLFGIKCNVHFVFLIWYRVLCTLCAFLFGISVMYTLGLICTSTMYTWILLICIKQ